MLVLPEEHRNLFKHPFGELHREIDTVIPLIANRKVYAVGDVVTHNLHKKGITPAIAVVDGQTMRSPCNRLPDLHGECIRVANPAGTITDELTAALRQAVEKTDPVTIFVEGEEDLAVIPLVIAAPDGAIVLYGQPREGVVVRPVDDSARKSAQNLLNHFVRRDA